MDRYLELAIIAKHQLPFYIYYQRYSTVSVVDSAFKIDADE